VSTQWGINCRTCGESLGLRVNHEDVMSELIRLAPDLVKLIPLRAAIGDWRLELNFTVLDSPVDLKWLEKHLGHDLVPQDEYGGFLDRCNERVMCSCCDSVYRCARAPKHDGPHGLEKTNVDDSK